MLGAFGRGVLSVIMRLLDMLEDLVEPHFVIGAMVVAGFYIFVFQVLGRLDSPPLSELIALVNLMLAVVMAVIGYFFGLERGRRENGNGKEPPVGPENKE